MINVDRYFVTLRNIIGQVDTPRVKGDGRWGRWGDGGAGGAGGAEGAGGAGKKNILHHFRYDTAFGQI